MSQLSASSRDRRTANEGGGAVPFDRSRSQSADPQARLGLKTNAGHLFGIFRNHDTRPAKKVVTAKLMGDPAPDRVAPDIPEEMGSGYRPPSPIYLTFAQLHAALQEPSQ